VTDNDQDAWASFGQKLIKERRAERKTSVAAEGFVRRMTSSVADPDAATNREASSEATMLPADKKER